MRKSIKNRIEIINESLMAQGSVNVNALAKQLNVSPETIRKDLELLEKQGVAIRIHGGAITNNRGHISPLQIRKNENTEIKRRLCARALSFIKDNFSVFIDASSTASYLTRLLNLKKNILLTTNCMEIAQEAIDTDAKIMLIGGTVSKTARRTSGCFALDMANQLSFDVAIFGTDGCSNVGGVGTFDEEEINLSNTILSRSASKILLLDSSKFHKTSRFKVANFSDYDVIITDRVPEDFDMGPNVKMVIEIDKERS